VIVFVGHTLLLCSIGFDVNNVTNAVVDEESGELDGTVIYGYDQQNIARNAQNAPLNPRLNMWRVRAR